MQQAPRFRVQLTKELFDKTVPATESIPLKASSPLKRRKVQRQSFINANDPSTFAGARTLDSYKTDVSFASVC